MHHADLVDFMLGTWYFLAFTCNAFMKFTLNILRICVLHSCIFTNSAPAPRRHSKIRPGRPIFFMKLRPRPQKNLGGARKIFPGRAILTDDYILI